MDETTKKRLGFGIDEFLLALLLISEILEFTGFLPADFDYVKKILSWVCLGYLLYKVNLNEIIFGYGAKIMDIALILAYFMLVVKDFLAYSKEAIEAISSSGHSYLVPFYAFVLDHAFFFQHVTFYIGGGMIILLSMLNLLMNTDIRAPSIMAIFHKEGPADSVMERVIKVFTSFIIYCGFFVIVFNLVIEWLGWAVDSTLAVLAIFFYLFFFIKHYKRLDSDSFLYKVGDAGEDFYEEFITLFRSKSTLLLGVSGLLVLHLLTDTGNFILPYIIGKKIEYFVALGAGHTGIPSLMAIDLDIAASAGPKLAVFIIYIFNIAAMLFMLVGPAFIWYEIYKKKRIEIPSTVFGIFFASMFVFLVSPIFRIGRIGAEGLYGVDILTKTTRVSDAILVMSIALVLLIMLAIISFNTRVGNILRYIAVFAVEGFFAYYIYTFFMSIAGFYAKAFLFLKDPFILIYLFVFLAITVFFYLGGIAYFIYDTIIDITKKFI